MKTLKINNEEITQKKSKNFAIINSYGVGKVSQHATAALAFRELNSREGCGWSVYNWEIEDFISREWDFANDRYVFFNSEGRNISSEITR